MVYDFERAEAEVLLQLLSQCCRQIAHTVKRSDFSLDQPLADLAGAEGGLADAAEPFAEGIWRGFQNCRQRRYGRCRCRRRFCVHYRQQILRCLIDCHG